MLRCQLNSFMNVVKEIHSVHEFIQVEFLCILIEPRHMVLVLGRTLLFIIIAAKISDLVHDFGYIQLASCFDAVTSNYFLYEHNHSKFLFKNLAKYYSGKVIPATLLIKSVINK
jgi:hypothetical protein